MKRVPLAVFSAIFALALLYWGCGSPTEPDNNEDNKPSDGGGPGPWAPDLSCPAGISAGDLDLSEANLGLTDDYVVIKFNNGGEPQVTYSTNKMVDTDHAVSNGHVSLSVSSYYFNNPDIPYNIIVTGTTANGSLTIRDGGRTTLYLNGADITNPDGPAINIQSGKRTDVHLVGSCDRRNKLTGKGKILDGVGAEQAKGTIFSEGSLVFGGNGLLEVRSTDKHAIVSDGFVEMESGNVIISESKGDGIHANERITIKGGVLQIKCDGDAVQNERRASKAGVLYPITVSGGKITIRTTGAKGHGIVSDSNAIVINDSLSRPDINITLTGNGSKGIRSHGDVTINGGEIYLEAYGARESAVDDTSSAAGIKADGNLVIKKGTLKVKSLKANENGKGFNVDGNITVSGGTTDIAADGDGVKVRGSFTISGGTLKSRSVHKKDIDCGGAINDNGGGNLDAPNK